MGLADAQARQLLVHLEFSVEIEKRQEGRHVAFGRKKQPSEIELVCSVVGDAVARAAVGEMPADFVDFTIENQRIALQRAVDAAGPNKPAAIKQAYDLAAVGAGTYVKYVTGSKVQGQAAEERARAAIATMLGS